MAVTVNQQLESRSDLPQRYGEVGFVELVTERPVTDDTSARRAILQGNVRRYAALDRVDPLESDGVKEALRVYFSGKQFPAPAVVFTQIADQSGELVLSGEIDTEAVKALGNGFAFQYNGKSGSVDLASISSVAELATALATALNKIEDVSGITVVAVGNRLLVSIPESGAGTGFAIPAAASASLPLNDGDRFGDSPLVPVELPANTVSRLAASGYDPRQINLIGRTIYTDLTGGETRLQRVRRYAEYGEREGVIINVLITDADNPGAATAGNFLFDLGQTTTGRNFISAFYSADGTPKHVAYSAVFSAINFGLANQHRNGAGRDLYGVNADVIAPALQDALTEQNANFYLRQYNFTEVVNGTNLGEWTDVIYVSAWLEREVANVVRQARKDAESLTIDAEGESVIYAAMNGLFERFDQGGFVQRNGEVTETERANIALLTGSAFDGNLPSGFLTLITEPAPGDRNKRVFAPVYYWVVYRASANDITINGYFQQ